MGRKTKFIFQRRAKLEERQTHTELTVHTATVEVEQISVALNIALHILQKSCSHIYRILGWVPPPPPSLLWQQVNTEQLTVPKVQTAMHNSTRGHRKKPYANRGDKEIPHLFESWQLVQSSWKSKREDSKSTARILETAGWYHSPLLIWRQLVTQRTHQGCTIIHHRSPCVTQLHPGLPAALHNLKLMAAQLLGESWLNMG